jgi:preprotein translocase SecE subunit
MAVAVKHNTETASSSPFDRLAVASLVGALYVFASLAVTFYLVPMLWRAYISGWLAPIAKGFGDEALLGLAMFATALVLAILGSRLIGPSAPRGLRAGIFFCCVALLLIVLITTGVGFWIESWFYSSHYFGASDPIVGGVVTAILGALLVFLIGRMIFRPGFESWLASTEEAGWFSTKPYKANQGVRVRRGTILGILLLAGAGIYTLVNHKTLDTVGDWHVAVPFTGKVTVQEQGTGTDLARFRVVEEPGSAAVQKGAVLSDTELADLATKPEATAPLTTALGIASETVMDRFTFHAKNEEVKQKLKGYVKVTSGGTAPDLHDGDIVKKEKFDKERAEVETKKQQGGVEERVPKAEDLKVELAASPPSYLNLTILPAVRFTLPLLLAGLALWFAWRVVNVPTFADFLIATEAEMNKVSWTSRKRLYQDTIVVLVTVILMTFFLLFADVVWSQLLRAIKVLQPGKEKPAVKARELPW